MKSMEISLIQLILFGLSIELTYLVQDSLHGLSWLVQILHYFIDWERISLHEHIEDFLSQLIFAHCESPVLRLLSANGDVFLSACQVVCGDLHVLIRRLLNVLNSHCLLLFLLHLHKLFGYQLHCLHYHALNLSFPRPLFNTLLALLPLFRLHIVLIPRLVGFISSELQVVRGSFSTLIFLL